MRDERGLKVLASPPRVLRGNREHRWRCANTHVSVVDGARPFDGIANSDSRGLGPGPELEVLGPIVVAHAVDVVNRLTFDLVPPEKALCDPDVFEDVGTSSGPRMSRNPHHLVASLVSGATSFSVPICLTDLAPAALARRRFDLFTRAATAQIPPSTRWTPEVSAQGLENSTAFLAPLVSHARTVNHGCNVAAHAFLASNTIAYARPRPVPIGGLLRNVR